MSKARTSLSLAAAIGGVGLLDVSVASADPVTYSVVGQFADSGSATDAITVTEKGVKYNIQFSFTTTATAQTVDPNSTVGVVYGTLSVIGTLPSDYKFDEGFTLTIDQTSPLGGAPALVTTLTGHVNNGNDKLTVTLDNPTGKQQFNNQAYYQVGQPITTTKPDLVTTTYYVLDPGSDIGHHGTDDASVDLAGLVAQTKPVPTPAAVWSGVALLGAMGVTKRLRRRSAW